VNASDTHDAALPELRRGPVDFDWVTIPAGDFLIGSDTARDGLAFDEEMPQHTVYLPVYRIARVPVTVAQFAAFMAANPGYRTTAERVGWAWSWTGAEWQHLEGADWAHPRGPESNWMGREAHPVTCVSWLDAMAFCHWAGVRLPNEAEWEKAARGTEGLVWPWGNQEPNTDLCNFDLTVEDTTPVGRYPAGKSPYGLLDVAGNVWEWTSSLWGRDKSKPDFGYPYDIDDGREDTSAPDTIARVARGGAFMIDAQGVRCASRYGFYADCRNVARGFRVVALGS
jgi:formylglycine-generating enzyme required for sulfatase activity